jgi:hypothetical protein
MLVFRKLRQEDHKFEASLGNLGKACLKIIFLKWRLGMQIGLVHRELVPECNLYYQKKKSTKSPMYFYPTFPNGNALYG